MVHMFSVQRETKIEINIQTRNRISTYEKISVKMTLIEDRRFPVISDTISVYHH